MEDLNSKRDYEETSISAEILACADENYRQMFKDKDQTMFAMRAISTWISFYKVIIPDAYLEESDEGLPLKQSIVIKRWPRENKPYDSLDLTKEDGRYSVLETLIKIRKSLIEDKNYLY